MTENCIRDI